MRVISGTYRGKKLKTIDDINTRPTTDRVKENVFNLIPHFFTPNTKVLDIFGGSGQVGIEFASRGCKEVVINELNPQAINVIKENIKNIACNFKITNYDAFLLPNFINTVFDYIYIDGPYDKYDCNLLLEKLQHNITKQTIIIVETNNLYHKKFVNFDVIVAKKYGQTKI